MRKRIWRCCSSYAPNQCRQSPGRNLKWPLSGPLPSIFPRESAAGASTVNSLQCLRLLRLSRLAGASGSSVSLKLLIAAAYDINEERISGIPDGTFPTYQLQAAAGKCLDGNKGTTSADASKLFGGSIQAQGSS